MASIAGGVVLTALVATGCSNTGDSVAVVGDGAVVSYRAGIDPDNVGIPLVTSSIDLAGSLSFIIAVALLGVA